MKFNKISRKLAAALMAGAMMASMVGMTSMAKGFTPDDSGSEGTIEITKKIEKEETLFKPAATFTFNVTSATTADGLREWSTASDGTPVPAIMSGDMAGIKIDSVDITSEPSDDDLNQTIVEVGNGSFKINEEYFTNTGDNAVDLGIYRYVVTEKDGKYQGVVYSTDKKYLDVYVYLDEDGNRAVSYGFVNSESTTKTDGVFKNIYGKNGEIDLLGDLTIEKKVNGNQVNAADKTKQFNFTITVEGETGEKYLMKFTRVNGSNAGNIEEMIITSGTEAAFTLANDESAVLYGLDSDDNYTVVETDANKDGFTTTDTKNTTGTVTIEGKTVTFTNTKDAVTPTGVAMTIAPYILMVALAGVFAFLFLRRRHSEF